MIFAWLLAALHLIALGIGLGAVWTRARALRRVGSPAQLARAFRADAWWGAAAGVWIATGLARLFLETERPIEYYLQSNAFLAKMGLLVLILALEARPMVSLIRWRVATGRGEPVDTRHAGTLATISFAQAALVVAMVLAATAMTRGLFH